MQKHTQNPYPLPKTSEPLVNQTHKLSNKPFSNKLSSDLQLRRIGFFAKGWERERERTLGFWFGILGFLRVFSLFNIVLGWFLCLPQLKISKFDFCDVVFGCQESSRIVEKVTMVGLFEMLGWAASYCTEAQVFWVGELGSVQLQLTLVRLVHELCPFFAKILLTCPWQA